MLLVVVVVGRTTGVSLDRSTGTTAIALLSEQHSANALVDGFQLREVGRGELDGIAGNGKNDNVLPRVQLILVLDHLWSLPIVLDASALQRELLHFNRHRSTSLCFDHRNIVF